MVHFTLLLSSIFSFFKEKKDRFLILSFLILFIFAALRYEYGNDYISYYNHFYTIKYTDKNPFGIEYLFFLLNKILPSFQIMIIICSAFFLSTVFWLVKTNLSKSLYGISIFIFLINPYLFLMNLSSIRQSIAISFFIIAVNYSYKRKIIPYFTCMLFSVFFHKSSIILLPFYFIANKKAFSKVFYVIFILFCLSPFIFKKEISNIIEFVVSLFNDKNYEYYLLDLSGNSLRATILSLVLLVYVLLNIKKVSDKDLMYTKIYLFALLFAVLAYSTSMMTRLQMFFDVFSIIVFPKLFLINYKTSKSFDRVINVFILPSLIVIIYLLRYYSFFTNDLWESFRIYKTVLFK